LSQKLRGNQEFSLDRSCPKCTSKKGFKSEVDLEVGLGYLIICNNCGAKFSEVFKFDFWEEI